MNILKLIHNSGLHWAIILILLITTPSNAQNYKSVLAQKVEDIALKQHPQKLSLFDIEIKNQKNDLVSNVDHYTIRNQAISDLLTSKLSFIEIPIQIDEKVEHLKLIKTSIQSEQYRLRTSDGRIIKTSGNKSFYRGIVDKEDQSAVALSVFENEVKILISGRKGNFQIQKTSKGNYSGYYTHNLKNKKTYSCDTPENIQANSNEFPLSTPQSRSIGDCVEIYFECDNKSFTDNNSSLVETENWVNALCNEVAILYDNENIPIVISDILIWTTPDPYVSFNSTSAILTEFAIQNQNNYNGRLAHLLSTRSIGGGIAWVDVLCNNYNASNHSGPYAVSASLSTSVTPYPNYSWNVTVVAHEMGHNFGSSHTHACVWNGNNTQIDDCGNEYYGNGGSCYDPNNPVLPSNGGTIMSYCHLDSEVGINFSNGFGPQPGSLIYNEFNTASCSTGTNCGSGGPQPPANDNCANAIGLSVGSSCNPSTFTNEYATASGATPVFTCGNAGTTIDVWFETTVPASGEIIIETGQVNNGLTNTVLQVYSGNCGNLVSIACNDNSGEGNHALVSLTGRTPNETLIIRVIDWGSNNSGAFSICAYNPNVPCHPRSGALVNFYNSTNGSNWTNKSGWEDGANGSNCDVCSWNGVTCDGNGDITSINLTNNNLSGVLPSDIGSLGNEIDQLVLYFNNIGGTLPGSITSLSGLDVLDLGSNNLSGTLPSEMGDMTDLNTLYLDYNNLTGALPTSLGNISGISIFWINNNSMQGCFPSTYTSFCSDNTNFNNNSGLPGNGNYSDFCNTGHGNDADADSYCSYYADCDDSDPTIYPGAVELCDGLDNNCNGEIDESVDQTNTFNSPSGSWHINSNWSLGHVPSSCETVILPDNGNLTTVLISSIFTIDIQKLIISDNVTLVNQGVLNIEGSIDNGIEMENGGKFINFGTCNISNFDDVAIDCFGDLDNYNLLNIQNADSGETLIIRDGGKLVLRTGSVLDFGN